MIKFALPLLIVATCIVGIFADEQRILDSECAKYCYQVAIPLLQMAPIFHSKDAEINELNMQIANFQNKLVVYEERERKSLEEENKYNELNDKFNEINKKLAIYEYRERKSLEEGNKCNELNEKLDKQLRILLNLEEREKKGIEEMNKSKQLNVQLGEVQEKLANCEERDKRSKENNSKAESSLQASLEEHRVRLSKLGSSNPALNISNQNVKEDLEQFNNYSKYNNSCLKQRSGVDTTGTVKIEGMEAFSVRCVNDLNCGPGWMMIQKRIERYIYLNKNWSTYRKGFSNINGNFFIGLEKLYRLTNAVPHELYIDMQEWNGVRKFAHYDNFRVGNESEQYPLKDLGNYTGNAGDALRYNNNMKFSTWDRDNDNSPDDCAEKYSSGWWFNNCTKANLNGWQYGRNEYNEDGIWWLSPEVPLKNFRMLIRPKVKK